MKNSVTIVAALALLAIVTPAKANLVLNGSFETTTLSASGQITAADVTSWDTTKAAPTASLGFVYFSGTANNTLTDQFGANNFQLAQGPTYPATSPDGGNFLVVDSAPAYVASISQTISGLTIGKQYSLQFYQAAGQQNGAAYNMPTFDQWSVTFGPASGVGAQTFLSTIMNNPIQSFTAWNLQTMVFKATAVSQVLTFLTDGGPDGLPPMLFLDGVDLYPSPEPTTVLYAVLGLSGLIAVRRLRNTRN